LRTKSPSLVIVSITSFGCDGPWSERPATEFTLQAACGSIGHRGDPSEPPVAAGGRVGEFVTGTYAAVAALAALRAAERTGCGDHIDIAMLDCMAVSMTTFPSLLAELHGWRPLKGTGRNIETPSIEPTADGYVSFTTNSRQQFQDFLVMIGRSDLLDDEGLAAPITRHARREEFLGYVHEYTTRHKTARLLDEAAAFRVPAGPVGNGTTVTAFDHFVERETFIPSPTGRFRQPRVPYQIQGTPARPFASPPSPGEHDGQVDWQPQASSDNAEWSMPLAGVRVLDCTAWWAGPSSTQILAFLGADVVKVESTRRPDLMRLAAAKPVTVPQWWEWGAPFHGANTGKRGIAIDLTKAEGKATFEELVKTADILVENFSPRVMEQFGLGWDDLHAVNPRLTMVRMPAFGLDGPWRDRGGFAQTMESISGMAWVTGREGGPPLLVRGACDPIAGMHTAFATLLALRLGGGRHVESVMVESALNVAAEQVIEYEATGQLLTRQGNRGLPGAVQDVYQCAGDDRWLAISAVNEGQQAALAARTGGLDSDTIADFCADRDADVLAEQLTAAGVPAAAVIAARDIARNPQLRHRRLFEMVDHPVTGHREMLAAPFRMSRIDNWVMRAAPTIGQHNDEILHPILGGEQLARLRDLVACRI
jgi:crotonobetainyl-CoA:carnitine CoA-transferase CaiB-like acyl-CoA transferase